MTRLSDVLDPELIKGCEVIVCDNVAHYYFDDKVTDNWTSGDFPNIAPPFRSMFVEWKIPGTEFISGVLIESEDLTNGSVDDVTLFDGDGSEIVSARWILNCRGFLANERDVRSRTRIIFPRNFSMGIGVTSSGQFNGKGLYHQIRNVTTEESNILHSSAKRWLYPALLALSFMHCKNVELKTQVPPAPLSKKHQKKTGQPLVRYKVLEIEPMKKVLRTEGQSQTLGLKHALHICRGHFKDYSNGGGLFGKYKGLYWWESHVRGDLSQGVVVKDYSVNHPVDTPHPTRSLSRTADTP